MGGVTQLKDQAVPVNNMETTHIMVKSIKESVKKKLKIDCVKKGLTYAEWIEEKLSTFRYE